MEGLNREDGGEIKVEKEGMVLVFFSLIAIVLLFVALRLGSEAFMNIIMRGIFGTLGIYCINQVMIWQNITCELGINYLTVIISATLGFPGIILLYAIRALSF